MGERRTRTALELLENKFDREPVWVSQFLGAVVGVALGVGGTCAGNFGARRPIFSGIQRHLLAGAIGGFVCNWIQRYSEGYFAERDAVYRHYIQLHPDDFPMPEKRKISDILENWDPIR